MTTCQPLPLLWLLSDERNDERLEDALARLPEGSGFVFRHYHLAPAERRARFDELSRAARARRHLVIVSGGEEGFADADGIYAKAQQSRTGTGLFLVTAHHAGEIEQAERSGADGIFLSPVFATRSHPGGPALGPSGFNVLAQRTALPVIALGGMTAERAENLGWQRWGAIDGLG